MGRHLHSPKRSLSINARLLTFQSLAFSPPFHRLMNAVLLLLAPLVGWLSLFAQVHVYWGEGSYYSYGWAVPFLALALATRRLRDLGLEEKAGQISRFHVVGLVSLLLALIPLRLVAEPDPYWRLPLWGQAFVLIALSLIALRMVLGKSVIRSFLFPCLFPLTAMPWPTGAESVLVYTLSGWVTAIDAEIMLLCGQPAEVIRDIILVSGQHIEIDAHCSGIRSFQCLLALGLFFGEYFRLSWPNRGVVALAGLAFAFGFNLCRALVLSFIIIEADDKTYDVWHNPVGYATISLSFLALLAFAHLLSRLQGIPKRSIEPPIRFVKVRPALTWLCLLLAVLPETITQTWFRYGVNKRHVPEWTIDWTAKPRWKPCCSTTGNVAFSNYPMVLKQKSFFMNTMDPGLRPAFAVATTTLPPACPPLRPN